MYIYILYIYIYIYIYYIHILSSCPAGHPRHRAWRRVPGFFRWRRSHVKSSQNPSKNCRNSQKIKVRRGPGDPGARSGSHGGPQGGPRTPKSPKTTFEGHPGPPLWEAIFGTFLFFLCFCGKKNVSKHSWKRCCFGTSIFKRNLVSQSPPGTPKI